MFIISGIERGNVIEYVMQNPLHMYYIYHTLPNFGLEGNQPHSNRNAIVVLMLPLLKLLISFKDFNSKRTCTHSISNVTF